MMLPTLISLSVAPGSYFFCASAFGAPRATAARAAAETTSCLTDIRTSFGDGWPRTLRGTALSVLYSGPGHAESARDAHRHEIHEADQEHAVDCPWRGLRDVVGDVRHELDEDRAENRPRDRGEAADHDPDQERDRHEDVEAVRRDELDGNRPERSCNAGVHRADPEGERLVHRV